MIDKQDFRNRSTAFDSRLGISALVVFFLVAVSGAVGAQPRNRTEPFVERVDVAVVNVQVFVTDAEGQPVTGLTDEDFVVLQDGEPVTITNFYAAERPRSIESSAPLTLESLRAQPARVDLPPERRHNLVVYVDHQNIHATNRRRVLDDLAPFLDQRTRQGDYIMLVGYDGGLDIVQPFTRDVVGIEKGLEVLGKAASLGQIADAERTRTLRMMELSAREGEISDAHGHVRSFVQKRQADLRLAAKALQDMLRVLAGLPGRKALIYVSDGLPSRPGEELYLQLESMFPVNTFEGQFIDPAMESLREDQGALFDTITREANAQRVTFYPVDGRGSRGGSFLSAANPNVALGDAGNSFLAGMRDANLEEPLIELAEATGGTTVLNTLNFDRAFEEMEEGFDTFYSLGYALPSNGDGRFHEIEVTMRQPGLKARHRAGFVDKPVAEQVADRTLSSLFLDNADNPLGISVVFGTPEPKKRKAYLLPVLVRIPLDAVTLIPQGKNKEGRLQIYVVVRDEKGGVSAIHKEAYPVSLTPRQAAAARGQDIGYSVQLEVRGGTASIAAGVWDEVAGTQSFKQERVLVGGR